MVEDETKWQRDKLQVIGSLFKKSVLRAYAKVLPLYLDHSLGSRTGQAKIKPIFRAFQLQISSFGKLLYCCFPNGKATGQGI